MFDPVLAKCLRCEDFVAIATDADARAYGLSMVTQTNSAFVSYDQIVKDARFGRTIADTIYAAIVATGSPAAAMLYVNYGIDLSLDETQAGLDQIATSVPFLAAACGQLKLLGKWPITVFASRGVTWLPALADITFHRAANVGAINWQHAVFDLVPALLSQGANWSTIKTAINGM